LPLVSQRESGEFPSGHRGTAHFSGPSPSERTGSIDPNDAGVRRDAVLSSPEPADSTRIGKRTPAGWQSGDEGRGTLISVPAVLS